MRSSDVLIIGAGPAGTVAAAMLARRGVSVTVLERSVFPRFSIGESLLPQCMAFLEAAGLLSAVQGAGFQLKDGAVVTDSDHATTLRFAEKSSPGWDYTWEVERARFDHLLADAAAEAGARLHFGETLTEAEIDAEGSVLRTSDADGGQHEYRARFTLDASGAGRVLPRRLGLDRPSRMPPRAAVFTHVEDRITAPDYDRCKFLLGIHPEHHDIWYWLIPFPTRASVGVVCPVEYMADDEPASARLRQRVAEMPLLAELLADAEWDTPVKEMRGYATSVEKLYGPGYALLGNAGEFLDPVFSSGVTLAMKSSVLAAELLSRQLRGEAVDWEAGFERPLREGAGVFGAFIDAWYRGTLQTIFFASEQAGPVRRHLCSILAGYVWDADNPYTHSSERRLAALATACQ